MTTPILSVQLTQPETAIPQFRTQTPLCTSYGLKQLRQTEELVQLLQLSEHKMQDPEPESKIYPLTQSVQMVTKVQLEQGEMQGLAMVTPGS